MRKFLFFHPLLQVLLPLKVFFLTFGAQRGCLMSAMEEDLQFLSSSDGRVIQIDVCFLRIHLPCSSASSLHWAEARRLASTFPDLDTILSVLFPIMPLSDSTISRSLTENSCIIFFKTICSYFSLPRVHI